MNNTVNTKQLLESENLKEILEAISIEQTYQEKKWGTEFDDQNTANDWVSYIDRYAAEACKFNVTPEEFATAMIKVATLAVSAVKTLQRNGTLAKRHYDE